MASISIPAERAVPLDASARIPWYSWLSAAAVTSAVVGVEWDISWHRSIGRDSFLTPAHLAIYLCGVLAGIVCGYLILATTFRRTGLAASSVTVWGFKGPLGAFIASWGGIVMLTSAPFDDWWHGAYGLDVKVLSPPHVMLALGILSVAAGALVLLARQMNRDPSRAATVLFLYTGALMLTAMIVLAMDFFYVTVQHSGLFYRVLAMVVPGMLATLAAATGTRWAATAAASVYTVLQLLLIWILPLFPATPRLGPVFHPVTHFIPPEFPLLIVVPAALLDTFWWRTKNWNLWSRAAISGALFVLVSLAVQWPFAEFLESPYARNAVFGMDYFDYLTRPGARYARHLFTPMEATTAKFWLEIGGAFTAALLMTRAGFSAGRWLGRVQR